MPASLALQSMLQKAHLTSKYALGVAAGAA